MPILAQTSLSSSDKRDFLLNSLNCQAYGDISSLSSQFNVSRKAVYLTRDKGLEQLDKLLSDTEDGTPVYIDDKQIDRTIIAMSIAGVNSIRSIENCLPLIYPNVTRSFGYIQALQIKAQGKAKKCNAQVELSSVNSIAIDEVFCQNEPVLGGIDLDSGFLVSLSHEKHRDGVTWQKVLEAGQ